MEQVKTVISIELSCWFYQQNIISYAIIYKITRSFIFKERRAKILHFFTTVYSTGRHHHPDDNRFLVLSNI